VGLVQTLPAPAGRETLFARLQQFAARAHRLRRRRSRRFEWRPAREG
jgi:hypothetical protein